VRVPVRCGLLVVDFERGHGKARRFAFETDRLALGGTGTIDLAAERFDALLTPHRHDAALLALDRSIKVAGSFRHADVALAEMSENAPPGTCTDASTQP